MQFSPKINCLIGLNGMGKTNLLDAIYYLSFLRGHIYLPDQMIVKENEEFCILEGDYLKNDNVEHLFCAIRPGKQKIVKRNKKQYSRTSEHIGRFPLVMISPKDFDLIHGGSDERRRFVDALISQESNEYLSALMSYKRVLDQRNSILKQHNANLSVLDILEQQMAREEVIIRKFRENWIQRISPIFKFYYNEISNNKDNVDLIYQPSIKSLNYESIIENWKETRKKDFILGYTSSGSHKDDFIMNLGTELIRKIGSQGQNKTYLIALKLSQYIILKDITGTKPILLLDDVFDKLDAERVNRIVEVVAGDEFGQIFMTDTNRDYLDKILEESESKLYKLFNVQNGNFTLISGYDGK